MIILEIWIYNRNVSIVHSQQQKCTITHLFNVVSSNPLYLQINTQII